MEMKLSRYRGWKSRNKTGAQKECLNDNLLTQDMAIVERPTTSYSKLKTGMSNVVHKKDTSASTGTNITDILPEEEPIEASCPKDASDMIDGVCGLPSDPSPPAYATPLQPVPAHRPSAWSLWPSGQETIQAEPPQQLVESPKSERRRLKQEKVQLKDGLKAAREVQKEMEAKQQLVIAAPLDPSPPAHATPLQQVPVLRPSAWSLWPIGQETIQSRPPELVERPKSKLRRLKQEKAQLKDDLRAARDVQKEMEAKQKLVIATLNQQHKYKVASVESVCNELREELDSTNKDHRVEVVQTQLNKLQEQVFRLHKDLELVHLEKLDVIVLLEKLIRATDTAGLDHAKMTEVCVLEKGGEPSLGGTESTLTDSSVEGWFCSPCAG